MVNDNFELRGLITVKDIQGKATDFRMPAVIRRNACVSGPRSASGRAPRRVELLVEAGVDVITVDTARPFGRRAQSSPGSRNAFRRFR